MRRMRSKQFGSLFILATLAAAILTSQTERSARAADEAKDAKKADAAKDDAANDDAAKKPAKQSEQVRLYVEGAYCAGCATVLEEALALAGVKNTSKISPNAGDGYVIVLADFAHKGDLGKVAGAINGAGTPHKKQAKPGVSLELFAKLGDKTAEDAKKALAKIDGVDAKGSTVDAKRGVLGIRLAGGEKPLTVASIVESLGKDGIEASIVTNSVKHHLIAPKVDKPAEEKPAKKKIKTDK